MFTVFVLQCKYNHFFLEYQNLSDTKFKLCSVVQLTFPKSLAVCQIRRIFAMWFRGKADEPKEAAPSRPPLREEKKLQRRQKLTNRVTNTLPIEANEGTEERLNVSLPRDEGRAVFARRRSKRDGERVRIFYEGFTKGCRRVRGIKLCTNKKIISSSVPNGRSKSSELWVMSRLNF